MKSNICLIIFCSAFMSFSLFGQDDGLERAIQKSMSDFKQLVAMEGFANKALPSAEQLANARTAQPIPHQVIELDALRSYDGQANPDRLIRKIDRVSVPVENSRQDVIATIELDKGAQGWQTSELSGAGYLQLYEGLRKRMDLRPDQVSLVRVPALRLSFLGTTRSGELQLALLGDQPIADIQPGDLQPARDVLRQLVPIAQEYNGLPW